MQIIPDLVSTVVDILPQWGLVLLALVLAWTAVPAWIHYVRSNQIRTRLRWIGRSHGLDEAKRWGEEAFAIAEGNSRRLLVLAEEALKLNQKPMFERALSALAATGELPREVDRLSDKTKAERPRYRHPVEAAVAIERLVEQGMREEARIRLTEARVHFPSTDELNEVEAALAEDQPPA